MENKLFKDMQERKEHNENLQRERFVEDRNAALRSLDKSKLLFFMRKYNLRFNADDDNVFWNAVHQARLQVASFTPEEKAISIEWILNNNFPLPDNVEVIHENKEGLQSDIPGTDQIK